MTTEIAPPPPPSASQQQNRKVVDASFACAWLSWVGATRGCLNALGVECDNTDVAGHSGYAFRLQIHETLCPSGPTWFPWSTLLPGVHRLGRTTLAFHAPECHTRQCRSERTRGHCAAAFEFARREIDAGRPCVINGAYVPELAICVGIEGDCYLVDSVKKCQKEPQPPIRFDELDAPGGLYVLAFPTSMKMPREAADREAINDALDAMSWKSIECDWAFGPAAFEQWAASLETNKAAAFGNAYNAQCWAEARRFAEQFVGRVAARHAHVPALRRAQDALKRSADALGRVAMLFPFPGKPEDLNEKNRREAAEALRAAKAAEVDAFAMLRTALEGWERPQFSPADA